MNLGLPLVVMAVVCALGVTAAGGGSEPPAGASPAGEPKASASAQLKSLEWMSGSWVTVPSKAGNWTEEHWMTANGTMMLGMARTTNNLSNSTTFYEHLRIESREDGVYYVAQPKGQPATEFKLVKSGEKEAVFENPAHDFPTRIIYRRTSDTELFARIEGTRGGKATGMDIPMRKAKAGEGVALP